MPLTKKQLKKIETIIKDRFLGLSYEMFGDRALTTAEINRLKRAGLLRSSVRSFTGDAYTLGRVASMIDHKKALGLTYEQVLERAKDFVPVTGVEKAAIDWARDNAGLNVTKISDAMVGDITSASHKVSGEAIRAIQDEVSTAILERRTVSQLKTSLMDAIDNKEKDWQRVAFTEMNEAIQKGVASEIRKEGGKDQLVYKQLSPDACKYCVKAFMGAGGVPKVFKLSELAESNVGRKAADWLPTVGSLHPWCLCILRIIPDGFDFVKKESGEVSLEFTGTTASETISKSETFVEHTIEDCKVCGTHH